MGAQLRVYRQKIKSAQTTKKITRAMELIAASRIQKALARVQASAPYARAVTRAVSAVATYSNVDHVLTTEPEKIDARRDRRSSRPTAASPARSTRTCCGQAKSSRRCCASQGKEVVYYLVGRRAVGYFASARALEKAWIGDTDSPSFATAQEIGEALVAKFVQPTAEGGVDEIHIVYNRFVSMLTQTPEVVRLLPLEVVEGVEEPEQDAVAAALRVRARRRHGARRAAPGLHREPHLQRAAAVRGEQARGDAEGDEVGERQRRQAHPRLHPTGEQRAPVRDHPADFRDRRRRRRPELGEVSLDCERTRTP